MKERVPSKIMGTKKGGEKKMEQNLQIQRTNGAGNGESMSKRKSQPAGVGSILQFHHNIFNPNKYMLKLPKTKKVRLSNGQIKWEQTEADYLPVAARIMWFRREHPDWSIVTKTILLTNKAVVMKAIIKNAEGRIIATARKRETEIGFPDYIEKAETGAVGRALAMCGYGTLQAPEMDEGERLADAPIERAEDKP
jgi:hypothetical protein